MAQASGAGGPLGVGSLRDLDSFGVTKRAGALKDEAGQRLRDTLEAQGLDYRAWWAPHRLDRIRAISPVFEGLVTEYEDALRRYREAAARLTVERDAL